MQDSWSLPATSTSTDRSPHVGRKARAGVRFGSKADIRLRSILGGKRTLTNRGSAVGAFTVGSVCFGWKADVSHANLTGGKDC